MKHGKTWIKIQNQCFKKNKKHHNWENQEILNKNNKIPHKFAISKIKSNSLSLSGLQNLKEKHGNWTRKF